MDYQEEYLKLNMNLHDSEYMDKVGYIYKILPRNHDFKKILDVACGSGKILLEISKKCKANRVVGVDISKKIIDTAKANDTNHKVTWVNIDIFNYYVTGFDLILAVDIVEHIDKDLDLLNKISEFGKMCIVKVPIEDNFINRASIYLSRGLINPLRDTEIHYGHIHHYSLAYFLKLIERSHFSIIDVNYAHLPKRSKMSWEILRVLFLPIWFLSKKWYIRFNGGFVILLLTTKYGK